MCDIVDIMCQGGCGRPIETHIGDYCVPPEAVRAWCSHCVPSVFRVGRRGNIEGKRLKAVRREYRGRYMLFEGIPHVNQFKMDSLGGRVLFVCDDGEAHDIHLNIGVERKCLAASMDKAPLRRRVG